MLSQDILSDIRSRGCKRLIWQIVKSLLFYAVTFSILFATEANNHILTRKNLPVWFWGIFVILIFIPIVRYRFYMLPFTLGANGIICEVKNGRGIERKQHTATSMVGSIQEQGEYVNTYRIYVKTGRGVTLNYLFTRENATFAREYYRKGDKVYLPPFANYPYNESHETDTSICLWCGSVGHDHEHVCRRCGLPFPSSKNRT